MKTKPIGREDTKWIVDTGASRHICGDAAYLIDFKPYQPHETPYSWRTAGGNNAVAIGTGTARIGLLQNDGSVNYITFPCVYNPECEYSLWATGKTNREDRIGYNDIDLTLHDLSDNRKVIGYAKRIDDIPFLYLTGATHAYSAISIAAAAISAELAHRRLAHAGIPKRRTNQNDLTNINDVVAGEEIFDCEACRLAKSKKIISHDIRQRAEKEGTRFGACGRPIRQAYLFLRSSIRFGYHRRLLSLSIRYLLDDVGQSLASIDRLGEGDPCQIRQVGEDLAN
ncbi:hypothetical protein NUU61_001387 [Penicillium alfredii]|uniref:Retrovirus-related Pol polyprotein from transposon TNT 1-94-like beta-barrel domain-containing protein n=1 Tax=Penicillium alfredii TaxID=1506179 RepID=A0A9W9G5N5_9EURO|nr:uncharacterized protein NUU61_001387 [Penicillium alfredii]KAJ5111757.1 hypothetical protein NUU61_001387 [Penicillium alfredii]